MKYIAYIIFLILIFGINVGFFSYFRINQTAPNLLLIVLVLFSLDKEKMDFLFIAVLSGIFLDFYTGFTFGSFSFALVFLAFILNLVYKNLAIFEVGWKFLALSLILSTCFVYFFVIFYNLAVIKLGIPTSSISYTFLKRHFLSQIIYNLLLLYPVYWIFEIFQNFVNRIENKKMHL